LARSRRRFSHDYEVRNRRARAEGYRSDYDRRIHDHGRIPPGEPPLSGARKARARGHERERLLAALKPGAVVLVSDATRDAKTGRYKRVVVTVIDLDGSEREFVLRGSAISATGLGRIADRADDAGAVISPTKSLDLRVLASELNVERLSVEERLMSADYIESGE
jgi:hypothetical protein